MKKAIIASLALASAAVAFGQGIIQIDSLIGSAVVPIFKEDGTTTLTSGFAQVYRFDAGASGGIGAAVGTAGAISASGRFRNTGTTVIDGVGVQQRVGLIVRAWDGGATWDAATTRGASADWLSKPLGGPDPGGGAPFAPPKLDGFASFSVKAVGGTPGPGSTATSGQTSGQTTGVVPEPSTIALGVLGAAALVLRRRK